MRFCIFILVMIAFICSIEAQVSSLQIYPSDAKMRPGSSLQFTVVAMGSDGSYFTPSGVNWTVNGGGSIAQNGFFSAGLVGTYTVTAYSSGYSASAQVRIKTGNPPFISSLQIFPNGVKIRPSTSLRFVAVASDPSGADIAANGARWQVSGGGYIGQDGTFSASGSVGYYTVTVWHGHLQASAQFHVKTGYTPTPYPPTPYPPTPSHGISRITVVPNRTSLRVGEGAQFTATAYDRYGRPTSFTAQWTATGGGTIDGNGYFRATYSGTYTVMAKDAYSGVYDTSTVVIRSGGGYIPPTPPTPPYPYPSNISSITVSPSSTRLSKGERAIFTATAYDAYGRAVSTRFTWTASGGSINQSGLYYAGYQGGSYQVTASAGGVQGTANVYVRGGGSGYNPPTPYPPTPYPPTPYPPSHDARVYISSCDSGGNFFRPTVKMTVQVFGSNVQSVKLYGVSANGSYDELDTRSCVNGQVINFHTKFNRLNTKYFEVTLLNTHGRVVARDRREVR